MKPEEQRITLAKWAGYTRLTGDPWKYLKRTKAFIPLGMDVKTFIKMGEPAVYSDELPDYLNDLNAVHGLEEKLPKEMLGVYAMNLSRVVGYAGINNSGEWLPHKAYIWHATAAQRCEALLKTLNLWKP